MAILDLNTASMPRWTSSTISATGATTLVAAPGAGYSIAVLAARVVGMTTTAAQVQSTFHDGTTTATRLWSMGISLGAAFLDRDMTASPWVLDSNSALNFACTLSASSTPTLYVEVAFQVVKR